MRWSAAGTEFQITLRYGDRKENCFINDDGRNRLNVHYSATGVVSMYRIEYNECEPDVEVIDQ